MQPRVTALVSAYNSERFIEGCLRDLEQQTIADRLEIIVIDSGSEQDERSIVERFQEQHDNIIYVRTERETLYGAWNRGIEMARGEYVINANTDDRHRDCAFELMARELDQDESVDLVYGDWLTTPNPNETFASHTGDPRMVLRYPEFFPPLCLLHFMFSPSPMWRRSVIDDVGPFDASLKSAGDLEWNIRFALKRRAKHMNVLLGLFLWSQETTSQGDAARVEPGRIFQRYRTKESVLRLYERAGAPVSDRSDRRLALVDMAVRAGFYTPPWHWIGPCSDQAFALSCMKWSERG